MSLGTARNSLGEESFNSLEKACSATARRGAWEGQGVCCKCRHNWPAKRTMSHLAFMLSSHTLPGSNYLGCILIFAAHPHAEDNLKKKWKGNQATEARNDQHPLSRPRNDKCFEQMID